MSADPITKPPAAGVVTELQVSGMTCGNCARHVTEAVQSVPGVNSAAVSLETGRVSVRWTESADPEAVLAAVEKAGYGAKPVIAGAQTEAAKPEWHWNLWLGGIVTVVLMAGEWVLGLGMKPAFQWFAFFAAGAVQIFAGAQFYRGAWRQLKLGSANMDTLVALGSTMAFGYSTWALFTGQSGHVYFMEAAAIIALISLGHWIEARVSARASGALKSLLQLAPQTARRIRAATADSARRSSSFSLSPNTLKQGLQPGVTTSPVPPGNRREKALTSFDLKKSLLTSAATKEEEVPVAELKPDDLVALRPGDRVPVDGSVIEGESAVDEAMLTGECAPVEKKPGSGLYSGTVNLNGRLVMRVTATGEATALAHVIAAVQRAQTSRANIQRLGDRVSNFFVPLVVAIAVAAGLWWGFAPDSAREVHAALANYLWHAHPPAGAAAGFIVAAAVLIIACPCAMGLATPAAIMASANAAAARGILIRDGVALEKAGEVTAVIFDKTGTLTKGSFEVAAFASLVAAKSSAFGGDALAAGRVQAIAAALARDSRHPVSAAVALQDPEEISFAGWREVRGAGVEGQFHDVSAVKTARLGSPRWLRESGVNLGASAAFVDEWSARGATIVGFALDQSLVGLFAVRDTLKPGAAKVVGQLQRQGLKIFLLTGDTALTAATLAREAGIPGESVFAEVRPEQKAEFVKKLQAQGERVAFVGDGINDAPALTQADLGIAVSRASDVAREAADIILLKSEIEAVPEALGLARATLRTIKQNLFWAFFYNALGVPLAALGFMSPVLCAAAMGVSDLVVIGNALRLARWRAE